MNQTTRDINSLFPQPPQRSGLNAEQVSQLLGLAVALMAQMPRRCLNGRQKQAMAGYLLPCGPLLCRDVACALRDHPALFPDIPLSPDEIEEGSRRARLWQAARDLLRVMAEIADEQYHLEGSTAVRSALDVVHHVRADGQRRFPVPNQAARQLALFEAEDTLAGDRRRGLRR